MTAPTPKRRLSMDAILAVNALQAAIDRMIKPTESYLNNKFITIPGLYTQLSAALASHVTGANFRGVGKSFPPMWVDAADKKSEIDLLVEVWLTAPPVWGKPGDTVSQLRELSTRGWQPGETHTVRKLTGIINAWADDIETLLNHDNVRHLTAACPACGADTVQHRDSGGDYIRTPALQISVEHGCFCQNCDHSWAPERFIDLAQQLGVALPEGVLQ